MKNRENIECFDPILAKRLDWLTKPHQEFMMYLIEDVGEPWKSLTSEEKTELARKTCFDGLCPGLQILSELRKIYDISESKDGPSVSPSDSTKPKEGQPMTSDEPQHQYDAEIRRRMLPLKHEGKATRVGRGVVCLLVLQRIQEESPESLDLLYRIVAGLPHTDGPEKTKVVEKYPLLFGEGIVQRDLRRVLLSAYQVTPEGPVLVNPFRLSTLAEVETVEKVEEDTWRGIIATLEERDDGPSLR